MLLQLLYLRLVDGNLLLLVVSGLHNIFEPLIEYFILIPLRLDIALQLLIVFPCLDMEFILHHLSFFNEDIHHNIDFFSDLVGFFLEKLEEVIACHQGVFQSFNLLVH